MKTRAQIVKEVMSLAKDYEDRMSYGGPMVDRDGHVHDLSAIHALMWALGAPDFSGPAKGIRSKDRLGMS